MTVIATASNPRFSVSRVDIDRGGPTYTIDTLRDLHAVAARRRVLLHHRCRRARPDPHLARRRAGLRARAVRGLHPARHADRRLDARGPADRPGDDHRDPGAGDLVDRVPRTGPQGRAGLVPRARRRRAVHRQTRLYRPPPIRRRARRVQRRTPPATCTEQPTSHERDRVTATDRAIELVTIAAQAASPTSSPTTSSPSTCPTNSSSPTPSCSARLRTTGRSSRSSTRSRTSCVRSAPSRSGARASATAVGC